MADLARRITESGTVAIASHDAGGAEILSSLVRRHGLQPIYILDGPAKKVFERKLGPVEIFPMGEAINRAEFLLCSTSWQSDLEFESIRECKKKNKRTAAFLDHWVNYRERFIRNGETCLPDEIWVGDPVALKMAGEIFPTLPVDLEENPYFLDIKDEVATFDHAQINEDGLAVLYVCEPIKEHAKLRYGDERHWGYVEEDALRYFLHNLQVLGRKVREVYIRPHPSERREKYEWVSKEFDLPIVLVGDCSLLSDIAASDIVVGCESMAMVIGLLASKCVISCIPPGGKQCSLPHPDIIHLSELVRKSTTLL